MDELQPGACLLKRPKIFLSAVTLIIGAIIFCAPGILWAQKNAALPSAGPVKNLPHYHEIMKIIQPLTYSGFYAIQKPGVTLSIDFKNRTWTLHGMRRYAPDGTLLLDEGRNGLCAELAYHTFQKLMPLLSKQWEIKFARVSEPDFFSAIESNHVVLILGDPITQATYLLDPSFHRYGTTAEFPRYTILGAKNDLLSFEKRDPDATLPVDDSFPLLIRNNSLILLSVESVSGALDAKNLVLAISSCNRSRTSNAYLMALRKENGRVKWLQNEAAMKKLFTPEEIEGIKKKFVAWTQTL